MNKNKVKELEDTLDELHSKGVLDLDSSLRDVIKKADKDGVKVGARMLICNSDHYCIVVKELGEK